MDLRVSLHKLEVLDRVVRLGGVGRAADDLVVSQPVVSGHLRSLEERLGVKLLCREGGQMKLTEAGQVVHQWARDLLARTRDFDRDLAGLRSGTHGRVVFAASLSLGNYLLPQVLGRFRTEHPEVELRMSVLDSERAVEDVRTGIYDFAVVAQFQRSLTDGEVIGSDHVVLVTAPQGPPEGSSVPAEALRTVPLLEGTEGLAVRSFVHQRLERLGVVPGNVVLQLGHPEALKRAAREGYGAALVLRSTVTDEVRAGLLREVKVADLDLSVPVSVVMRPDKSQSAAHRLVLDAIRASLA